MKKYTLCLSILICLSFKTIAQEINFDSLKLEPLQKYRIETALKDKFVTQVMTQIQIANAAVVPDSLASVMKGFPKEFMRQTHFGKKVQTDTNKSKNQADFRGRYRTYFRDEMHQIPDYEQDLKSSGY